MRPEQALQLRDQRFGRFASLHSAFLASAEQEKSGSANAMVRSQTTGLARP